MDDTQFEPNPPPDAAVSLDAIPLYSPSLLTLLAADGTIVYENPSLRRLFGFGQAELVDEPLADYIHPDDRQRVVDVFETVVSADDRTVKSVEYRHQTRDGSYLWVESVASSTPTPEGYYVINTRDISEQKQRERDLRATNDRLEQFARFISHDLRSPLSVARGYLELAEDDAPSAHHETVADALDRMNRLIDGLRGDTRVDKLAMDPEPVDLAALSTSCWQHVSTEASTLETEIDTSIAADRFRLMQLLENLFRNAVEHNERAVRITVGELDNGFYVTDDGSGIPAEKRNQVFETGYTTADDGTGFGLDIVTQVVDAHDWEISIAESDTGGVRFDITGVQFAASDSA